MISERLKGAGEGDDRGWDGWMASPTWWTWVWVNSGIWWRTGRPAVHGIAESQTWLSIWTELISVIAKLCSFRRFQEWLCSASRGHLHSLVCGSFLHNQNALCQFLFPSSHPLFWLRPSCLPLINTFMITLDSPRYLIQDNDKFSISSSLT